MAQEEIPDLYDIAFESVYDVDFAVLDGEAYQEAASIGEIVLTTEVVTLPKRRPYVPSENPLLDLDNIESLTEMVIESMREARWNNFTEPQILGIAKNRGGRFLSPDEIYELLARLSSHASVRPQENGSFSVRREPKDDQNDSVDVLSAIDLNFDKQPIVRDRPMSDKQLGKAIHTATSSEAARKAAKQAKRVANPRRRGRRSGQKKRLMGRLHGKKESVDQLITQMNEPSPK